MNILVTGGAGFIGSNFVLHMLHDHPNYRVVNLDKLTYAGNLENLREAKDKPNYCFVRGDICDPLLVLDTLQKHSIEAVVNFAAETHVDRSITGASEFIKTNVFGTCVLLEAAKEHPLRAFIQISTDEVYGSLGPEGQFTESSPLHPNSPYAASKASADLLTLAYHHTFKIPSLVTRCSNNYGHFQFPEKLIPLMIINAMAGKSLPVYGDGENIRDWIHVEDHCAAIDAALHKGVAGEVYNVGSNTELTNIQIVRLVLQQLGKSDSLITFVKDRLGHDRRYAIDSTKAQSELGWRPKYSFKTGLCETIEWYKANKEWRNQVVSGEFQEWFNKMYGTSRPVVGVTHRDGCVPSSISQH